MPASPSQRRGLPHATVAAVIERDGTFLCVEERVAEGLVINQPAGHLEAHETLVAAVAREVLEETGHRFTPTALTGIYQYRSPANGISYLRFCFTGQARGPVPGAVLDRNIVAARWYARDQLAAHPERLRSPMVVRCIDDYLAGHRLPLSALRQVT